MMQSQALLAGRVLIGLLFLVPGVRITMSLPGTVAYFSKLNFPAPELMVWLAITIEIGGAALLIVGWKTRWVSSLLAVFVLVATATAHRFWEFEGTQYENQLHHFLKNLAIIGGLLYVIAFGPGAMSVDGRKSSA
jgi:putative oxidoreductase